MGRIIDETGNRYGRLTVVRRNPENAYHKGANWICRCECGGERVASGIGLRQGLIKSCGCLIRETRVLRCACGYKGQKTRDWTPDWKCYRCSGRSPLQEPPKMTEDEIFEKRAEHWRYYHRSAPTSASHDVMLFLERLEKVTKERDEARERNTDLRTMLEQVTRDRDHVEESLVRLETQRDEARALVDQLGSARDKAEAELRELQRSTSEALAQALEWQRERDEARADVERYLADLRRCASEPYEHAKERAEAYRRGAEAMREACVKAVLRSYDDDEPIVREVRALPIPEEP